MLKALSFRTMFYYGPIRNPSLLESFEFLWMIFFNLTQYHFNDFVEPNPKRMKMVINTLCFIIAAGRGGAWDREGMGSDGTCFV